VSQETYQESFARSAYCDNIIGGQFESSDRTVNLFHRVDWKDNKVITYSF